MRIPIPRWVDGALDLIALILFPSRNPIAINVALAIYTLMIGIGLSLTFGNWLWLPGTIVCMVLAWMISEWM